MATVDLYLLTEKTIVRMTRTATFERLPMVGEFIRIDAGGLFPRKVTEVTHDLEGTARIVLGVTENVEGGVDLWENDSDLRADVAELENNGWSIASERPNHAWKTKR